MKIGLFCMESQFDIICHLLKVIAVVDLCCLVILIIIAAKCMDD